MSSAYTGASACRGELELHQDLAQAGQVQIRTWQVHLALKGQYNVRRYISDDNPQQVCVLGSWTCRHPALIWTATLL